jgi:hypothetical protein
VTAIHVSAPPAGPHSPGATSQAADGLITLTRYLNHATGPGTAGGLHVPADTYTLLGSLYLATGALPQLTRQLARWLTQQAAAGTLRDDRHHDPATAIRTATSHLHHAARNAEQLTRTLQTAQNAIATLTAPAP